MVIEFSIFVRLSHWSNFLTARVGLCSIMRFTKRFISSRTIIVKMLKVCQSLASDIMHASRPGAIYDTQGCLELMRFPIYN